MLFSPVHRASDTGSPRHRKPSMPKTKADRTRIAPSRPGEDGSKIEARRVRTGTTAVSTLKVRGRPGTFEWRYGRHGNAQYHAGAAFARMWERAGIANVGAGIPRLAGRTDGRPLGGIQDARVAALDKISDVISAIDGPMVRRLVAYCVEGRTPKEIAAGYNGQVSDIQMSDTLDVDLFELARAMKFAA